MTTGYVQVVVTTESQESALELARSLVHARLGSAGQVFPLRSVYWWDGEQEADEWQLVVKTTDALARSVISHVRERHSYEVPEVIVTPITDGLEEYLDWIGTETSRPAQ